MKTKITIIGMLLFISSMGFAQKKGEPYHQFSLDAGYTFSSLTENKNHNQLLFAGNGVNLGVRHRWGDNLGIASRVGFSTGSVDESGTQNLTARLPIPPRYIIIKPYSYSQFSLMTGPSIKLGKKHQFEFNAMAGIGFNPSTNMVKVDAYDVDQYLYTVYEAKDKSVVGLWQVNAKANVIKLTKNSFLGISAGYGSNGLSVGVSYDYVGHVTLLR